MGRSIYASDVGSGENDTWVHKFWLGVQPSDVEDYLEQEENISYTAELSLEDESKIRKQVVKFKKEFHTSFGRSYEELLKETKDGYELSEEPSREQMQLAARINLGEHLLATIENMKKAGFEHQVLDIEV